MRDKASGGRKQGDFTTLLIFPPQWTPQNPHFAIASLAGHLRSHGHKVILRDLNIEFYDEILSPEYLEVSKQRMLLNYNYLYTKNMLRSLINDRTLEFQIEGKRFIEIEKFLKESRGIFDRIPSMILDAKETLRDPRRFYNPLLLVDAFYTIDKALEMVSLPFYPARLSFNSFEQPDCLLSTESLIEFARNRSANLFYEYFERHVPDLLSCNPDLVAISINSFSQVLPGLTLAAMIREKAPPSCFTSIGGNFFGRVKDALLRRHEFFRTFTQSVSLGEGEKQLLVLVEELMEDRNLGRVPNFLYLDEEKSQVRFTFEQEPERLDNLGIQDLEGLPLEKYLTPEIVACIQSSKGCYWGKCTFCDTDFGVWQDMKSIDRLLQEIRCLKDRYGIRHYEFVDESILPSYMRVMADRFIKENLGIYWFSNARTEASFTKELLDLLHKSGLTMLLWGFESGARRIMELINKGVDIDSRFDILRASAQAGIWNFAYVFFGFPSETREEAMETIQAICDHKDIIHSYGRSVFTLGKHSPLYLEAERYGIIDIIQDMEELSTNLHYISKQGLHDEEVDEMMRSCTQICAEAYDYSLWYYLRYRENIHLYLAKFGLDYVANFKVKQALESRVHTW